MSNRTLTIIKPDAVNSGSIGGILKTIQDNGFKIGALYMRELYREQAEEFYQEHAGRPYFNDLVSFMSSGPIVTAVLEKENAVADYRKLMGATKVEDRAEGTIRKTYGTDLMHNAVHGSDSDANAEREIEFFFVGTEIF